MGAASCFGTHLTYTSQHTRLMKVSVLLFCDNWKDCHVLLWGKSLSKNHLSSCMLTDVDECQQGNLCMNGQCKNTDGSFRCTCGQGYQLSAAKDQCEGRCVPSGIAETGVSDTA